MRTWKLKLDKYGIQRDLYDELKAFCRQYGAKRERLRAVHSGFNDLSNDGMPRGSGVSDPTFNRALRAQKLSADIEVIERSIAEACEPGVRKAMLLNVAFNVRFEDLPVPISRGKFFEERRLFFFRLAVNLGKIDDDLYHGGSRNVL